MKVENEFDLFVFLFLRTLLIETFNNPPVEHYGDVNVDILWFTSQVWLPPPAVARRVSTTVVNRTLGHRKRTLHHRLPFRLLGQAILSIFGSFAFCSHFGCRSQERTRVASISDIFVTLSNILVQNVLIMILKCGILGHRRYKHANSHIWYDA